MLFSCEHIAGGYGERIGKRIYGRGKISCMNTCLGKSGAKTFDIAALVVELTAQGDDGG